MLTSLHIHDVSNTPVNVAWIEGDRREGGHPRLWCWWLFARSRMFGTRKRPATWALYYIWMVYCGRILRLAWCWKRASHRIRCILLCSLVWFSLFVRGWNTGYPLPTEDVGNWESRTHIVYGMPNTYELTWH